MNHTLTNRSTESYPRNDTLSVVLLSNLVLQHISIICFFILFCFGGFLDIFVIYVMARSGQLRKNISSFLIFHVSFTHLLFHIIVTMTVSDGPLEGRTVFMCKMSAFIEHVCPAAIFSTLVAIAWDRHENILHPFKSLVVKSWKSYLLVVAAIWCYSIVSSVSFVHSVSIRYNNVCKTHNAETEQCEIYTSCHTPSDWKNQTSETIFFLMAFCIPLFYMLAVYTRIAVRLWKRGKNGVIDSAVAKHKTKLIRLLLVAVFGFVICWGPSTLLNLLDKYKVWQSFESGYMLRFWFQFIAPASSSCMNTPVYAFFSPAFRKNCIRFGCCCCSLGRLFIQCCGECGVNHHVSPGDEHTGKTTQRPAN